MYISPEKRSELTKLGAIAGSESRAMCEKEPVIIWEIGPSPLLLCGEHAQYLGTHLLKDVRSYEIANLVSVKVRTELTEHPHWDIK